MALYLVSKASQDESVTGIIQVAETVVYGVFSTSARADEIAEKYNGTVSELVQDMETSIKIQRWINPGYAS